MNGNNLNGNNVNLSNLNAQISPESQLLNNFSQKQAEDAGRKIASSIMKGIEQGFKNTKTIEKELDNLAKKLNRSVNSTVADSLDPKVVQLYNKQLEDTRKIKRDLKSVESQLIAESEKEVPNEKEVIRLKKEQLKHQAEANELLATQQFNIELVNLQREREVKLAEAAKEVDKKKADELAREAEELSNQIGQVQDRIDEIHKNIQKSTKESINALDEANKKAESWASNLEKGFNNVMNSVKTVVNLVDNYLDFKNIDTAINAWSQTLDQYTKLSIESGLAFSTGFSNTKGFQSFKNDMINAFTDDGLRGIYDKDQLMNGIRELSKMGFQNSDVARDMANDIQFAREYLGISAGSLKDMYSLQVRTNDDQFVKKSLNAVISLQKAGNVISQEHLDKLIEFNSSTLDKLLNLGMNPEAAAKANQDLLAIENAYDATYGEGTGQSYVESLLSALTPDNIGTNFANPIQTMYQVQSGNMFGIWENFKNGPATQATLDLRSKGDAVTNFMLGSDTTALGGVDSNLAYRLSGKDEELMANINENLRLIQEGQDNDLEEAKKSVEESISDSMKTMNGHMEDLLKQPWDEIANSISDSNFAKTAISRFQSMTNIIASALALLTLAVNSNTVAQSGKTATTFLGGNGGTGNILGRMFGAGSTLGGTTGVGFNLHQGLGNGLLAKGVGLAGVAWTANDAISAGTNGIYDSSGNQIMGSGFGTGVVGAVSGTSVATTESAGSDSGASASNIGGGTLSGAAKGAMIGSLFAPGIGTAIGAGIGAIAGAIGGWYKDNKRKEAEEKKREEEKLAQSKTIAENIKAIRNQRDVALSSRFNDDRYGTSSNGMGDITTSLPAALPSPVASSSLGRGGEYRGVDIDGWVNTSDFGSAEAFRTSEHKGIDFAGKPFGHPVGAATSGTVTSVVDGYTWRDSDPSRGIYKANYVDVLNDTNGITYRYYHLSKAAVQKGQQVTAGNVVGYVGNTGFVVPTPTEDKPTNGTHLHFAALKDNQYIDPRPYVTSSIFYPGSTVGDNSTSSSSTDGTSTALYNRDASPVNLSYIPSIAAGSESPAVRSNRTSGTFRSPSIEEKLDNINNTLTLMGEKQENQQRLLDALSNSPIYNLGV